MAGITYFMIIVNLIILGLNIVIFLRIYNFIADMELFGFKLPRFPI